MHASLSLKLLTTTALVLGSLWTASLAASGAEPAGAKAGRRIQADCGVLNRTQVAQSGVSQVVTVGTPTDLNGSTVTLKIRGTAPSCVLINFSAQALTDNNEGALDTAMIVQAVLDDTDVSIDGAIEFVDSARGQASDAHAYNFTFFDVPPGRHTLKIQFWSSNPGNIVAITDFDMHVRHN